MGAHTSKAWGFAHWTTARGTCILIPHSPQGDHSPFPTMKKRVKQENDTCTKPNRIGEWVHVGRRVGYKIRDVFAWIWLKIAWDLVSYRNKRKEIVPIWGRERDGRDRPRGAKWALLFPSRPALACYLSREWNGFANPNNDVHTWQHRLSLPPSLVLLPPFNPFVFNSLTFPTNFKLIT